VKLYFSHPTPNLLKQLGVGPFALETDLMQILSENMDKYKSLVEAEAPADWQEIKEQVAARVVQQQQDEERAAKQQRSRPPPPVAPRPRSTLSAEEATEFVDAFQVAEQTKSTQQQSTAQGQLAAPAAWLQGGAIMLVAVCLYNWWTSSTGCLFGGGVSDAFWILDSPSSVAVLDCTIIITVSYQRVGKG